MTKRDVQAALGAMRIDWNADTDVRSCSDGNSCSIYSSTSVSATNTNPNAAPKKRMPNKAKTVLIGDGKHLNVDIADCNGFVGSTRYLMSDIVDVRTFEREHKSQVVVYFADNTRETATVEYGDTYNLEQGISICIAKKLIARQVGNEYGSSIYNKLVERGLKVYKKSLAIIEKRQREEEEKKTRYQKLVEKKQAKRKKREEADRERQIEIQKEAYLRAMREFHITPSNIEVLD